MGGGVFLVYFSIPNFIKVGLPLIRQIKLCLDRKYFFFYTQAVSLFTFFPNLEYFAK